jgi:ElaB/YqjD/DUF883 family membrane-anchored ribosome-binding protein
MTRELARSAQRLENSLSNVVSEAEQLLRTLGKEGTEQLGGVSERLTHQLAEARAELDRIRRSAAERTGAAARATDTLAHEHPWTAVGIAAATGALVAWLITRR